MKHWKVIQSKATKTYYYMTIRSEFYKSPRFITIKNNLTENEAKNFSMVLNKLRS